MLTAINILDSQELKNIISKRISKVKIEDFIKSTYTITELENALFEAVNSDIHWKLAEPLIERIQKHFKKVDRNNINSQNLLFEISLLLAFKQKDLPKLMSLEIPKLDYISNYNKKMEERKQFFIAIFKLYYENEYDEAIKQLESLLSRDPKNIYYAFHLYKAKTLKALR